MGKRKGRLSAGSVLMLALTVRLYKRYRTLNIDEIANLARKEDG